MTGSMPHPTATALRMMVEVFRSGVQVREEELPEGVDLGYDFSTSAGSKHLVSVAEAVGAASDDPHATAQFSFEVITALIKLLASEYMGISNNPAVIVDTLELHAVSLEILAEEQA